MRIYTHTHTHTHTHIYIYVSIFLHTYVHIYLFRSTYVCMYVCMYIYIYIHTHINILRIPHTCVLQSRESNEKSWSRDFPPPSLLKATARSATEPHSGTSAEMFRNPASRRSVSRTRGSAERTCSEASTRNCQHTSACVSIHQHTSAYVSIRQHTSAYVSIRQQTSANVSKRRIRGENLFRSQYQKLAAGEAREPRAQVAGILAARRGV
jgi:hypothetical protein